MKGSDISTASVLAEMYTTEKHNKEAISNRALREALKIIGGVTGYELDRAEQFIRTAVEILGGSRHELFLNAETYLLEQQQKGIQK